MCTPLDQARARLSWAGCCSPWARELRSAAPPTTRARFAIPSLGSIGWLALWQSFISPGFALNLCLPPRPRQVPLTSPYYHTRTSKLPPTRHLALDGPAQVRGWLVDSPERWSVRGAANSKDFGIGDSTGEGLGADQWLTTK